MSRLFRQAAMDKLSSPEQLDQRIVVISPLRWLIIAGGALIGAALLVWALCGQMTVTAEASGVYLNGDRAMSVAADDAEGLVVLYCPLALGKTVSQDMTVLIYPSSVDSSRTGHMTATVSAVEQYVTGTEEMQRQLGDSSLVQAFAAAGPVVAVTCRLETDPHTLSGFTWSNRNGAAVELSCGTPVRASIVLDTVRPITFLLPITAEVTP